MSKSRGIVTVQDLKDRCRVDGDCWIWSAGVNGNGQPSMWMPALQRHVTLGVAICTLVTGKPPKAGVFWYCTCDTKQCANPAHRKPGNKSAYMLAAGIQKDAAERARIAATKRAKSSLSDEAVADIRYGNEVLTVVAARYGIDPSYASLIRRGKNRRELGCRGASVFNLGA